MEVTAPQARPRRQRLAIALLNVHLLTAVAAVVASWFEVESLLVTGPLLLIVGLALAVVVRPLGAWAPLLFGLSGPIVSAVIAFAIATFRLEPAEAAWPVFTIFAFYLIAIVPLAIVAIGQIRRWQVDIIATQRRAWRYSIKSLLALMTVVAILTAVLTSIAEAIFYFPITFAAFGSAAVSLSGIVLWRFLVQRWHVRNSPTVSVPD